jgi:hypothetical protein
MVYWNTSRPLLGGRMLIGQRFRRINSGAMRSEIPGLESDAPGVSPGRVIDHSNGSSNEASIRAAVAPIHRRMCRVTG